MHPSTKFQDNQTVRSQVIDDLTNFSGPFFRIAFFCASFHYTKLGQIIGPSLELRKSV